MNWKLFKNVILNTSTPLSVNSVKDPTLIGFLASLGMTLIMFSSTSLVSAQELSFSLYPPHLETIIMPGKEFVVTYKVRNLSDPATVAANVLPFTPKEDGGIVVQDEFIGPVRFSLDNIDLQLDQPFFLSPKQSQEFQLRIRIPEGAPAGDYYYTFFVENDPTPPTEGKGPVARIQARIASNMLITVSPGGVLETKGKVSLFDTLSGFKLGNLRVFDSGERVPVILLVRNEGKNFIKAQGQVVLRGNFGETATYDLLPSNILTESQRVMRSGKAIDINCKEMREKYCQRPITLLLSGFFMGKYDLSANVNFGEGTPQLSSQLTFVALPLKFLAGLVVLLVVVAFLGRKFKQ